MAWITSKTGRVYLGVCAGVTAILLARDLPRLFGGNRIVSTPVAVATPFTSQPSPPLMEGAMRNLPLGVHPLELGVELPLSPITMNAMDTVTMPSGAKFSVAHLVQTAPGKDSLAFKPDGSPIMMERLLPAPSNLEKKAQCYLQVRQEQQVPQERLTLYERWGGFSAANNRLIDGYANTVNIALTPQEQKTGEVECVVAQPTFARTIVELPLDSETPMILHIEKGNYVRLRRDDDFGEYVLTGVRDAAEDLYRVVIMGRTDDSYWRTIKLSGSESHPASTQDRDKPENLQSEYRFRIKQPFAPKGLNAIAVVLVPYQTVTITGIVTKPKPATELGANLQTPPLSFYSIKGRSIRSGAFRNSLVTK